MPNFKAIVQPDNDVEFEWDGSENLPAITIEYTEEENKDKPRDQWSRLEIGEGEEPEIEGSALQIDKDYVAQAIPSDDNKVPSDIISFKTGSGDPSSIPNLNAIVQPDNRVELEWDGDEEETRPPVDIKFVPDEDSDKPVEEWDSVEVNPGDDPEIPADRLEPNKEYKTQVVPKDPAQQPSEIIPFKTGSGEPSSVPRSEERP